MKTGASTRQPLYKTWYFAFIEKIEDGIKKKTWCRIQRRKNGEVLIQQIRHKKAVRSAWYKEPEIVPFQFCGTDYMLLIPNPEFTAMPHASHSSLR